MRERERERRSMIEAKNHEVILCTFSGDVWHYRHGGVHWVTYFDWSMTFGWQTQSEREIKALKYPTQPTE